MVNKSKSQLKIPTIDFDLITQRIKHYWDPFSNNPHQAWYGTSRSGKSYAIRQGILPIVKNDRIVVLDVKPGGERTWIEFGNTVESLNPGFGKGNDGTPHYHMLLRNANQAKNFLDMIANEGSCIVILDDSRKITQTGAGWNLGGEVDELLTIGAAIGISVIICANSTVWAVSGLRDQGGINWIGQMPNEDERKKVISQFGLPGGIIPILGNMPRRHFLYSDRYDGELVMGITTVKSNE